MPARKDRGTPRYLVTSVDNALRLAAMLQIEGELTLSEAASRLGVAPSTAHRLLATLVHRDFATHDEGRHYLVGPVLALAAHAPSQAARLRAASLRPLAQLAESLGETTSLMVRTGTSVRFVASVECSRALRVGSREGMVFPAHLVTGGLVLLAALNAAELDALYAPERVEASTGPPPDLGGLRRDIAQVRRNGFAVNRERSEPGVTAVGRIVVDPEGQPVAGISVSLPSARYKPQLLPRFDEALRTTSAQITRSLTES